MHNFHMKFISNHKGASSISRLQHEFYQPISISLIFITIKSIKEYTNP